MTVKLISLGTPIPEKDFYGIRLPSAIPTTVKCDVHGVQYYEAREAVPLYCPACRESERKLQELQQRIRSEALSLARTLHANLPDGGAIEMEGVFKLEDFEIDATTKGGRDGQEKCLKNAKLFAERFMVRETKRRMAQTDGDGKGWREENAFGIRMLGSVGTGKTHLAMAIRDRLHDQGFVDAYYTPFQRLLDAIYSRDTNTTELLNVLGRISCLIIDEIGAYDHSEADLKRLFQIVDSRYLNGRPTIVITNLDPRRLRDAVGERTYERLRERTVPLVFNWESHRKSAKFDPEQLF